MDYSELVDKVGNMHSRIVEEFLGESVRTRVTVDETVIEFVGVSPIYEDPFGTQGMDEEKGREFILCPTTKESQNTRTRVISAIRVFTLIV